MAMRLASLLCSSVLAGALMGCVDEDPIAALADQNPAIPAQDSPPRLDQPRQLDQLVAPIALYPDALVAQILAASTFPAEIVEADRWIGQHSSLKGTALAQARAMADESLDPTWVVSAP
jgi:hypothetical protein